MKKSRLTNLSQVLGGDANSSIAPYLIKNQISIIYCIHSKKIIFFTFFCPQGTGFTLLINESLTQKYQLNY